MFRLTITISLILAASLQVFAEETFVTIHKVTGNRLTVSKAQPAGRGGSQVSDAGQQGSSSRRGRGRFAGSNNAGAVQQIVVTISSSAKITSGMRERRTFEFRAGAELAGGLKNRIFQKMTKPLSARIVTMGDRITEVNVITDETDINQSNTNDSGKTVIAIRPKRPPMKRK
ncbi:MAG: hypothetical protein ISQ06_15845 [Planctomycetaceae bacterium]|jgi:hypothetical protein|nr:hypothetical protein [Planctomycetaceae bacterium]